MYIHEDAGEEQRGSLGAVSVKSLEAPPSVTPPAGFFFAEHEHALSKRISMHTGMRVGGSYGTK